MTKAINSTGDNGGSRSGGSVNTIFEEELNETAILPSHENLKSFVTHGWHVYKVLMCHQRCFTNAKEKETIIQSWCRQEAYGGFILSQEKEAHMKGEGTALGCW